jgi:hypothetical protein
VRWCVTDAQLATLRWDAEARARAAVAAERNRHADELTRLTERVDAELQRQEHPHAAFVAHLQAEVTFWRLLYTAERQRNDVSTDQRLAERGLGGITGPTRPLAAEMPGTLEDLIRNTEMSMVGDAQGVER